MNWIAHKNVKCVLLSKPLIFWEGEHSDFSVLSDLSISKCAGGDKDDGAHLG